MAAPEKNQLVAAPDDEVQTSKFCRCFGYISCGDCMQDCFVNCNFCALCCNCSRCLQGTCQCIEYIGCVKCAFRLGCDERCVKTVCKKESALCMMIFNGIFVMVFAAMAAGYAMFIGNTYQERIDLIETAENNDLYTCKLESGADPATDIKDAISMMRLIYLILLIGAFLSCLGGPVNVLRWLSVPFHWLFGALFHMYGLFLLWNAGYSDNAKECSELFPDDAPAEVPGPVEGEDVAASVNSNPVAEDIRFIDQWFLIQIIGMVLFTLFATSGCY